MEGTCKQEGRLCNHFCRGNKINITYFELMLVAPVTKHEKLMRSIAICCLSDYTTFFHIVP